MTNGLAIWHYPHRTVLENVVFFAEHGFSSVSILGIHMTKICRDEALSAELASLIREKDLVLTVHSKLPLTHNEKDVENFKSSVDSIAKWQEKYGLISVFSFDVLQAIRDNVRPYVDYVLGYGQFGKVALEDFGLNEAERKQIESLKSCERFGYLLDIGHMYIRMRGLNPNASDLTRNSPSECPQTGKPNLQDFMMAFKSKEFPIFEIHLHNNDGVSDLHDFLEDGTLDIKIIADLLKAIRYDGILTIESAPGYHFECKYPESDIRILKTFDLWKSFLS